MDGIVLLTLDQIENAAKVVAAGQRIEVPIIRRLLRSIVTISV